MKANVGSICDIEQAQNSYSEVGKDLLLSEQADHRYEKNSKEIQVNFEFFSKRKVSIGIQCDAQKNITSKISKELLYLLVQLIEGNITKNKILNKKYNFPKEIRTGFQLIVQKISKICIKYEKVKEIISQYENVVEEKLENLQIDLIRKKSFPFKEITNFEDARFSSREKQIVMMERATQVEEEQLDPNLVESVTHINFLEAQNNDDVNKSLSVLSNSICKKNRQKRDNNGEEMAFFIASQAIMIEKLLYGDEINHRSSGSIIFTENI